MNRILSIVLSVSIFLSCFAFVGFASDYDNHWAKDEIENFIKEGIINGDASGKINPDNYITRAEIVKIINKYFGYEKKADANFYDIENSKWYAEEFLIAKAQGYITGDEKGFANPENHVTRAEVCVILSRILGLSENSSVISTDSDSIPSWAKGAVGAVVNKGYIKGYEDGSLRVQGSITRAEAISVISRTPSSYKENEEKKEEIKDKIKENIGNVAGMTSSGGSSGGGGGGGSSRPAGVAPARIDIRNYNKDSYILELTSEHISEFVFVINVGNREYVYTKNDILPQMINSGFRFDIKDIVLKTVKSRGLNNESYVMYIKGIAEPGYMEIPAVEFFNGIITIDLPVPEGLTASYNCVEGIYDSDKYLLSWNTLTSASEYLYEVYNSNDETALPVIEGTIRKSDIAENQTVASAVIEINSSWGLRDNLWFRVFAKDENTGIFSSPSEKKNLLLDAPELEGVSYIADDTYNIIYSTEADASYELKVGNILLTDNEYTASESDTMLDVTLKAYYQHNETKVAELSYNFGFGGGNGVDEEYLIYNERQFKNIAAYPDKSYKLCDDIELSATYQSITGFCGNLDGDNYTINLGNKTQGVFDLVEGNTTFKNLTVSGKVSGGKYVGAFVGGFKENGKVTSVFENCINKANVQSGVSSHSRAAGFVGSSYVAGLIKFVNCSNYGNVTSNATGNNGAAGFIGLSSNCEIIDCANYGNIVAQCHAGGMVGYSFQTINISDCANFGNVSITGSGVEYGAGGILGAYNEKYASSMSVSLSFNAGEITGSVAGGIVGFLNRIGNVSKCINVGTATTPIIAAGGIENFINNCYYLENSAVDSLGAIEKTDSQLKTENLISNFEIKPDYEYPIPKNINYISREMMFGVKISSPEEFLNIANDLNAVYILTEDIDLTQIAYTSISGFAGVLNGNGHKITLGTSEAPATQGLFATLSNGAEIKNLTVDGFISATAHTGAFANKVSGANSIVKFENCVNSASVNVRSGSNLRTGGFIGDAYENVLSISFVNCTNYGNVTQIVSGPVGGIAGIAKSATFTDCVNYATINGGNRTAGISGWIYNSVNASGCANFGTVTGTLATGGLFGDLQSSGGGTVTGSSVVKCFNGGNVPSGSGMIALFGATGVTVSDCINVGTVTNAIANRSTPGNYCLENIAININDADILTSEELKNLDVDGFEIKENYDYPLPLRITYNPPVSEE